ncbi:hypothetical protein NEOLEDRAFT_6216 [Neolentinus lepideus HHB14362 ss-1]|uniref:Uncharacterized protein n=1 Tax=Neolentinus lepideus HHB14362 ss-1 TaxID=1314782 RepID=A0A165VYH3_9AGAM|nr:hypothetical protein NEOLEDRAFT_6216 [Neolentinus lepideus HHB14362 ss-1]
MTKLTIVAMHTPYAHSASAAPLQLQSHSPGHPAEYKAHELSSRRSCTVIGPVIAFMLPYSMLYLYRLHQATMPWTRLTTHHLV